MQGHCHTKLLATRYSLFAIRYSPVAICRSLFAIRHSLLAAVFGSAGISPSHFSMPHVPCPMFRLKLVVKAVAIPYLASRQLPVAIFRFTGALSL
jgi:hypothetical protein